MIEPGQQFRVDSVEELIEAYEYLDFHHSLEDEMYDFKKDKRMRYIQQSKDDLCIFLDFFEDQYETIPNPFKKYKTELKGIDKALDDLSNEAKKLGFGVEVIFKNLEK